MSSALNAALTLCLLAQLSTEPAASVRRFESRYRSATTLQTTFLEQYSDNGRVVRSAAGIASFRRPGKMRWEYHSPDTSLFLVDGKSAWFYVPADHTVTRVPAKHSSDWRTPLALLVGGSKLSRVCSAVYQATTEAPQKSGSVVLFCAVKGAESGKGHSPNREAAAEAQGDAAFLEIDSSTGILNRVLIKQPGGVAIEFKFANWQFDQPLPESLFHFIASPGTAIVNGELPSGESNVNR